MPEVHDVQLMHEEYIRNKKGPAVALGDLVAFRIKKNENWDFGWVSFANAKLWKPGDSIGTNLNIRRCPRNFGEPMIIENCLHINDPMYQYDTQNNYSCWEKVGMENMNVSNMSSLYNELYADLQKAKIAEGEVVKLKAELEQVKIIADNATREVAKFSSLLSQIQVPKKKEAA